MFKKKKMFLVFPDTGDYICDREIDDILYTAFNAGGISKWADHIWVSERKFGTKVHEQVSLGGAVLIHCLYEDTVHRLDMEKLLNGLRRYILDGKESLQNGQLVKIVDVNDADAIVQLALFGEVKYL